MPVLMTPLVRSALGAAAVAALLPLANPALAMSERDASAVNQKLIKAKFLVDFTQSGLQNIEGRPPAAACRDIRAAKSDMAAAAKLAREALDLIGHDMMGEYKDQRTQSNIIVQMDAHIQEAIAGCTKDGF